VVGVCGVQGGWGGGGVVCWVLVVVMVCCYVEAPWGGERLCMCGWFGGGGSGCRVVGWGCGGGAGGWGCLVVGGLGCKC